MAQYLLATAQLLQNSGDCVAGDVLGVFWDSVAETILVKKNGVETVVAAGLDQLNTSYRYINGVSSYDSSYAIAAYSFCDGTDLMWFRALKSFASYPYFALQTTTDSPVCDSGGGAVCNIQFRGEPIVVHSSSISGGNGSITVSAITDNGLAKYSLSDVVYSACQSSGFFDNLSPGTYTVYAKDFNQCTATITITILYKPDYNEHYRFTWNDIHNQRTSRVRLYERDYVGDVVEITKYAAETFTVKKPKQEDAFNDKFFPLHPTSAILSLLSQVDYQYLPLFTQDNKRFLAVYEVDEGAGFAPQGSWFIVPSVFQESFTAAPYYSNFQLSDNLRSLQTTDFSDINGNLLNGSLKLIEVLAFILKRTGLELGIRSGINIFEENHDTGAADDPLDQTYIDVACYRDDTEPFSCWDVMEAILKPFGARLFQDENVWKIEEVDRAQDGYNYRLFDASGAYVSNGSVDPVIDIVPSGGIGPSFSKRDQNLEIIPAYGKIKITALLNYTGAIVAGGFEKNDLLNPDSEVFEQSSGVFASEEGFKDWTLRLNGTEGVSFGRAQLDKRSAGAFYYNDSSWAGNLRESYIESAVKNYQYGPGDTLRLSFDHSSLSSSENYQFMVVRFALNIGGYYLQEDLSWALSEHIFRAYPNPSGAAVDTIEVRRTTRGADRLFNRETIRERSVRKHSPTSGPSFQQFDLSAKAPDTDVVVDSTIQLRIYFYASKFYDFGLPPFNGAGSADGLEDLKDFPTAGLNYDYMLDIRREVAFFSSIILRVFYSLRVSLQLFSSDDDMDIVRPDDYNASTNPKQWFLLGTIIENPDRQSNNAHANKFYLDNVNIDSLPNGQQPPTEKVLEHEISKYINEDFEVDLFNFDLPTDISNGKNIYNNYFRLSDGTPTSKWTRSGETELKSLQEILLSTLASNYSAPTFRLTGSFVNKFGRVKIGDYLRLTKSGSDISLLNPEFDFSLANWEQDGSGEAFIWTSDNGGSAEVSLTGSQNSDKIFQAVNHSGGFIEITVNIHAVPSVGNTREDNLYVLFYSGNSIIHQERLKTFIVGESEGDYEISHKAFIPSVWDRIGFFFKRVTGSGECTYQVVDFTPDGVDIVDVFQIADYSMTEVQNMYFFELLQISKPYLSMEGIDTGGTGQLQTAALLLEDGGYLLQEDGGKILLE